jgi:ribosome biogenesis GTPase / thiamine phosphate phosphatase
MADDPLRALGWDPLWEATRRQVDPGLSLQPVRIAAEHRGAYHALGPASYGGLTTAWVELRGRTFHDAEDKRALPVVGDWVLVERWSMAGQGRGAALVQSVLPRRTILVRKAAGEATLPQPLVANVDHGIIMTSANADLSAARLDRYIGLLRSADIEPVVVLSKVDLAADPSHALRVLHRFGIERVIALSALTGQGIAELRAITGPGRPAQTSVLLGSSGVGKSTLLNALLDAPSDRAQATRPIRSDDRGRHATTRRELFIAADGGLWIDTPGMRELAQWIESDETAFADISELAQGCRFRDCQHRDEPGCAVRDAVPAARLASFHKLDAERRKAAERQAAAARHAETRKARSRKRMD